MELVEKIILWILLSQTSSLIKVALAVPLPQDAVPGLKTASSVITTPKVFLNGPAIQTSDLRAIDGYVASGLPLFEDTHGFVLHSGMRPVIVKVKDPNKIIRDGIEQPNPGYYRDLPAVIPQGFEGVSSSSFILGNQIPQANYVSASGPSFRIQTILPRKSVRMPPAIPFQVSRSVPQMINYITGTVQPQGQVAESSIRVESKINLQNQNVNNIHTSSKASSLANPVVLQTSEFESGLPTNLKNPFYRNAELAGALAKESELAIGEEVVRDWETKKIREGRIRELLAGAGFI